MEVATTHPADFEAPFELDETTRAIQLRARRFTEDVLIPLEEQAERMNGRLPDDVVAEVKREATAARLCGPLHSPEHGGQGWTRMQWALVEEQYGRSTNAIHWHIPNGYNVWEHASDEHRKRWLEPLLRGEIRDAYAVTERDAGSDPSGIEATAHRTDAGFRINGEKWFVTSGDVASVIVVMANLVEDGELHPTLFVVDRALPGIDFVDDPAFTHSYPDGHPTIVFRDVEVGPDDVIGGVGGGNDLQRAWFMEERLAIAARCVGAMWRLLDETVAWAASREQGGARILDHQGVSFPLADSAADATAGRLLALTVAGLADGGADPKLVHNKASMAKLFTSEAAWRCADRCVQAFGGRGYLRSNVAERFLRELRVDRIWEGTSEIQRLIVARGLERRGVERMLHDFAGRMDLTPLLAPRSIAVVGATDRPDAYGDTILRNLERLGFDGPLWGVNPSREAIRDIPCVPSVGDLPEPVDAVAVAVPAAGVPAVVEAIAERGCGGVVVVSAGFGEVESGREVERKLAAIALAADLPVCGPNGNGVISFHDGAGIWGDSVRALEAGGVALISQSGNVAVNALGSRRGIGFHTVVSTGNGTVCDAGDWLLAASEREGVRSIALFLESDGHGPKLAEALAHCVERDVRVVVLKVGASSAGAAAARAHTGALAGDARIFRALIEEAGASWARNPHELLELARVLAEPRARPRGDGGLAILTCSGGDSGNAADEAERLGVELPSLGEETRRNLAELLPEAATPANPLDYTSLIWAERERLRRIVETVGDDPAIDQVLVFHDTPEDLAEEVAPGWEATRAGLADGARATSAAPLFASTLADLIGDRIIRNLGATGIAAAGGLSTAVLCARELRRPPGDPARLREIATATGAKLAQPTNVVWLSEAEAKDLLREGGLPVPDGHVVAGADGCLAAARELGFPVALKLSSSAIQHKSALGAMELGLADEPAVAAAHERLLSLPAADGAELLVEAMAAPGVELIVAATTDGVVPALVVGLGGIWTEALGDVVVIPLPASPERVGRAFRSLRGAPLLTGERGDAPVDIAALATIASRTGEVLIEQSLALLELNPLIAGPTGAVAVDALARRS